MGVRGLQSYVERDCPGACTTVYLKEIAEKHRSKTGKKAVLLVDGLGVVHHLYTSDMEPMFGGQWTEFLEKLRDFITRFINCGIEIIFVFDGTITTSKMDTWVKRRLTECQEISEIFSKIRINDRINDSLSKRNYSFLKERCSPANLSTLIKFAIRELGAQVQQTILEADEVLAEYASSKEEVFGILAQDSDFIIFNAKMYLSLNHLDLDRMTTRHYNGTVLARQYLKLDPSLLPLFSCLAGNDFVPSDMLQNFLRKQSKRGGKIYMAAFAPNIADVIRKQGWTGNPDNNREMESISYFVFGTKNHKDLFYKGLKSYAFGNATDPPELSIKASKEFKEEIYRRHLECLNGSFMLDLLCLKQFSNAAVFEDTTVSTCAQLIYRKIRQRCYGIAFDCFVPHATAEDADVVVNEWCAYSGNSLSRPEKIKPLPLKNYSDKPVPTFEDVWFKYSDEDKKYLFWAILQVPIEFEIIMTLPDNRLAVVCILNYLIGTSDHDASADHHLKPWEVAVFVAQAVREKKASELKLLRVKWSDARGITLATLFMRGVATLLIANDICGHPLPTKYLVPSSYFDGKLFHALYIEAKSGASVQKLCNNQENVKDFQELLGIVTKNTDYALESFDWVTVLPDLVV